MYIQAAESRYESLQLRCSGLEKEADQLRGELRVMRKKLHVAEKRAECGGEERLELSSLKNQVSYIYIPYSYFEGLNLVNFANLEAFVKLIF